MSDFDQFFGNDEPREHDANNIVKKFADDFNEWLEQHEADVHDGERCDEERGNFLGYMLHRMGFSDMLTVLDVMVDRFMYYTEHHQRHHHNGNGDH